jgi:TolB protein
MTIKEGMPVIPVAIPEFLSEDSTAEAQDTIKTLRDIITADLKYSRVFNPLPQTYYGYIQRELDPDNIFFKEWESIQAKLLIVGRLLKGEGGALQFEAKLYDVKSERFILGKNYQGTKGVLRTIAHRFCDELMVAYGEPKIFTTKIVFISNRDGNDELYMMDYDGFNQERLTYNQIQDYMPAWSADRQSIAYTAYEDGKAKLYLLYPYQAKRKLVWEEGTSFGPNFSPDGRWLAFCSTEDESNSEIYIATGEGDRIKRLTFNKAIDTAPSWAPTSRELAFTSDRSGSPQIYIMDREGSNVRRRSFGGTYHDAPAWAPTGDRIAYVSRVEAVFDLYVLNLRTDQIVKLTEGYARNESPTWSPDGRHIIFSSNRVTGTVQIYSIDYDGQNLRKLTSKGENKLADWSRQ